MKAYCISLLPPVIICLGLTAWLFNLTQYFFTFMFSEPTFFGFTKQNLIHKYHAAEKFCISNLHVICNFYEPSFLIAASRQVVNNIGKHGLVLSDACHSGELVTRIKYSYTCTFFGYVPRTSLVCWLILQYFRNNGGFHQGF